MNDPCKEDSNREGERRKGEAFANLEVHREWILLKARRVFAAVLLEKGRATIDDVRRGRVAGGDEPDLLRAGCNAVRSATLYRAGRLLRDDSCGRSCSAGFDLGTQIAAQGRAVAAGTSRPTASG